MKITTIRLLYIFTHGLWHTAHRRNSVDFAPQSTVIEFLLSQ